jgi:hypothetical protein
VAHLERSAKMKTRIAFLILCIIASVGFGVLLSGCVHENRPRYRDDLVEIREHSTVQLLNVHASTDTEVLTIWGRSFANVRGRDPCYLRIPGRPLILFVTGRDYDGGQAIVHLANISTHEISDFPAHDSRIGSNIGPEQNNWVERVESVSGGTLVIEAAFSDRRYRYWIDLDKPRFLREEEDAPSAYPPHKMEHHVYEEGKYP